MSSQKKDSNREDLLRITLKALREESYKERLMKDPTKAIRELYPEFASDAKIVVQDQTKPDTLYVNVSPVEAGLLYEGMEDFELTEEDLEMVAGGVADANGVCWGNVFCGVNWTCWLRESAS